MDIRRLSDLYQDRIAVYRAERDEPRIYGCHSFHWACHQFDIERRLTTPRCPWTNGQSEPMNRTLKDATGKRYHNTNHDELRQDLQLFVDACNYGRRPKTLRGLTPCKFIVQVWTKQAECPRLDLSDHMLRLNIW